MPRIETLSLPTGICLEGIILKRKLRAHPSTKTLKNIGTFLITIMTIGKSTTLLENFQMGEKNANLFQLDDSAAFHKVYLATE